MTDVNKLLDSFSDDIPRNEIGAVRHMLATGNRIGLEYALCDLAALVLSDEDTATFNKLNKALHTSISHDYE